MTAQQQDWLDAGERAEFEPVHVPGDGPHDVEDLDPEVTLAPGTVDFGAVRVPVPDRGTVDVDPAEKGRMQAVHVAVPEGRLSVSALAAPKSSRLWPDLAKEIDASLREGGARVRSFQGEWGRELHATSGAATSLFVGVDGARWMLYGVATGPTSDARALDEQLRRMMRGTIVVRGRSPYPVRTVLPLEVPEHLAPPAPDATGSVVELRPSAAAAAPAEPAAPTTALPAVARTGQPATAQPATAQPATAQPATAQPAAAQPARPPSAEPWTASPTTAMPAAQRTAASPAATALPPVGRSAASGWSPEAGRPARDASPPTTAFPGAGSRVAGSARWSDPAHRIAGPDNRPTDIRPARREAPPAGRRPTGGSETAPWALDPPSTPGSGGRRRLREPLDHLPASPGLTGPWAPWPDSPTGPGRTVGPGRRTNGHPAAGRSAPDQEPWAQDASPVDLPGVGRRPSEATPVPPAAHAPEPVLDPRPGRRRLADARPSEATPVLPGAHVPEPVLDPRPGRRRLADPRPSEDTSVSPAAHAPEPALDPRPGRRRLADARPFEDTSVLPGAHVPEPALDPRPGRRRLADARPSEDTPVPPRTGRRRAHEPAPTEALAVVPEVLRVGRHAAVDRVREPAPGRAGRGAETRPWVVPQPARPLVDTAPWSAVSGSGQVTEPLPTTSPAAERPTGRHHRPD